MTRQPEESRIPMAGAIVVTSPPRLDTQPEPPLKYYGFDWLRAYFCLAVVALHSHLAGAPTPFDPEIVRSYSPTLADIINFNHFSFAVPMFFLVSFFLYTCHYTRSPDYFPRRMRRVFLLYLFWTCLCVFLLTLGSLQANRFDEVVAHFFSTPSGVVELVMTGGGQLYWFFSVMLILTPVLHLSLRIKSVAAVWGALCGSLLLLAFAPLAFARAGIQSHFWYPTNFLPYVFSAIVLRRAQEQGKVGTWAAVFAIVSILASFLEWRFIGFYQTEFIIPCYSRISLVFGAMACLLAATYIRRKPPAVVTFLSDYSLGIYCLHIYAFSTILFNLYKLNSHFVLFASRVIDAIVITALMRRTKWFRRFV